MDLNATLLLECVFFLSFVWLTMKYVWPPINAVLEQRMADIQVGRERALAASEELERAHEEAQHILAQAHEKASERVRQSQKEARALVERAQQEAEQLAKGIMDRAYADIQKEKNHVRALLKQEVAKTALLLMAKVLKSQPESMDAVLVNALKREIDDHL